MTESTLAAASSAELGQPFDVGVMVALREEFRQLHPLLPSPRAIKDKETGQHDYVFEYRTPRGTIYRCVATFVGAMGPEKAAVAADQLIARCKPKTVAMLGVAAGIDDDVRLGDVVLGTFVNNYLSQAKAVPGKDGGFEFEFAGEPYRCNDALVRAMTNIEFAHKELFQSWQQESEAELEKLVPEAELAKLLSKEHSRRQPGLLDGPIAAGPVVGAAQEFARWLKMQNRKYLALEMESGGVLTASCSRLDPTSTIVLRGISDFGDQRKKALDQIGKGGLRAYAMNNPVRLLWRLLDAELLPRISAGPAPSGTAQDSQAQLPAQLAPVGSGPPVLVLYSAEDADFAGVLLTHLAAISPRFRLVPWRAGAERLTDARRDELVALINGAPAAMCLLSPSYFNTVLHQDLGIPDLLQRRHDASDNPLLLLPIIVRTIAIGQVRWLRGLGCFPADMTPIRSKTDDERDAIFAELVDHIGEKLGDTSYRLAAPVPQWPALPASNVRLERLPRTADGPLGRDADLDFLDTVWDEGRCRILALAAAGGVGKTALVNRWVEDLRRDNFRGARRVFAWSFYSQGTGDRVTSADLFVDEALRWFGDRQTADSDLPAWEKGQRLAQAIRKEKTLLILDGLEPLQGSLGFDKGEISDNALRAMLNGLTAENPGLCVITTREYVVGVSDKGGHFVQRDLEHVSREAVRALFRRADIRGTDEEYDRAGQAFGFHALAIHLLIPCLSGCPGRRVTFALDVPDLPDVSVEEGKHPRRVMEFQAQRLAGSPELNLLHVIGLFDRIATSREISALRTASVVEGLNDQLRWQTDKEWERTVAHLRALNILSPSSHHDYDLTGQIIVVKDLRRVGALDAHPLVRAHFGQRLRKQNEPAWKEGHRVLYHFLAGAAPRYPDTIQEMAALYQAVAHGCQAGQYQEALEVYRDRILRGTFGPQAFYTSYRLGAQAADLAAVGCFFVAPWTRPAPELSEVDQGWLLNEAGFGLCALGRLSEARRPMRAGVHMAVKTAEPTKDAATKEQRWDSAARRSSNLSELYLTLGDIASALDSARQSVDFADRSGDAFCRMLTRTTHARALHQVGDATQARRLFDEAESVQRQRQPRYPLLYALWGFRFCDLLLADAERAAWACCLDLQCEMQNPKPKIEEVEQRTTQTLDWWTNHFINASLFDIAIEHLTLGRAQDYRAILAATDNREPETAVEHLDATVHGLRLAGRPDYIPCAIFTRAWLRAVQGQPDLARAGLDEAQQIAERGPMRLHLADVHLHRARLFRDKEALKQARKLIEQCGYWRRKGELEDAEAAANGW